MRSLIFLLGLAATPALACGPDSDCPLGDRVYRIYVPDEVRHPGAIVYAHGYRGNAAGIMRSDGFRALADRLGVPLVAAQSYADDWRIPGVPAAPDTDGALEYGYFEDLRAELRRAHGIDPERTLFTGFSAGGMMVWQLACFRGDTFAAYAPIAGTFWQPQPDTCPDAPVSVLHTHGLADEVVPLTGRPIGPTHQGDVLAALATLGRDGNFSEMTALDAEASGELACTGAEAPDGSVMEYCTHPGGHALRAAYVGRVWERLQSLGRL